MRNSLLILAAMAFGTAALAQDPAVPATPAAPKAAQEKKICRAEGSTGSMMVKRVCHTKAEWAQIDAQNDAANDRRRNGNDGMSPN